MCVLTICERCMLHAYIFLKLNTQNPLFLTFFLDFLIEVVDVDCLVWNNLHDFEIGAAERMKLAVALLSRWRSAGGRTKGGVAVYSEDAFKRKQKKGTMAN